MATSRPREWSRFAPSRRHRMPTNIVMKFTDHTNVANISIGALAFSIHYFARLSQKERGDTFITVRKRQNLVALATYRASAARKLLAMTRLVLLGEVHTVSSYKAHDPANTRGVLHGVPSSFTLEQIRASLSIPGHRILDFRRMGRTHSILITIQGPRLPREAIFCSVPTRLYPPRITVRPCVYCLSLHHRSDVCPTRRNFVRCPDCGTKFPSDQDPKDTPHACELRCFNCHGDHSASDPSCQAWKDATEALRDRTLRIRHLHRDRLRRPSRYRHTGTLPGLSPWDRYTALDSSRSSRRRFHGTPNASLGEVRRTQSPHTKNQSRLERTETSPDATRAPPMQSRHGYLGTTSEQGLIAHAATSPPPGQGAMHSAYADSTVPAAKKISHSATPLKEKQKVPQTNYPPPDGGVAVRHPSSRPPVVPMYGGFRRRGQEVQEALRREQSAEGYGPEGSPAHSAVCIESKAMHSANADSTCAAPKKISHSATPLEEKQKVQQTNHPPPDGGVSVRPPSSRPHVVPMDGSFKRRGQEGPEALHRERSADGFGPEGSPASSAVCIDSKAMHSANADSRCAAPKKISHSATPLEEKQKVPQTNHPPPDGGVSVRPPSSRPHVVPMDGGFKRRGQEGPEALHRERSAEGIGPEGSPASSAVCGDSKAMHSAYADSTSAATKKISHSATLLEEKQKVPQTNNTPQDARVAVRPPLSRPHLVPVDGATKRCGQEGPEALRRERRVEVLGPEGSPDPSAVGSDSKSSNPDMADAEVCALQSAELQSRLSKLYEGRDNIQKLLQEWLTKADAVVNQVSSVSNDGGFVGPCIDGFLTLDRMFNRLFQVYTVLSQEDNSAKAEQPSAAHKITAYPSPYRGTEVPPQNSKSSLLSVPPPGLNVTSGARPTASYNATGRDLYARGVFNKESLGAALTKPKMARGREAPVHR